MFKFLVTVVFIASTALLISCVESYPADHREDTVQPFSLNPGNVNLETYYLDKYPHPGVPGGPLMKKPTSQMTPSPLDPAPVPESNGNMFLAHSPHAAPCFAPGADEMRPNAQFGADRRYPGGHRNQGFGLYNEDNLHLHHYPRHYTDGHFDLQQQQHEYYRNHQQQHHHTALPEQLHNNRYQGRY